MVSAAGALCHHVRVRMTNRRRRHAPTTTSSLLINNQSARTSQNQILSGLTRYIVLASRITLTGARHSTLRRCGLQGVRRSHSTPNQNPFSQEARQARLPAILLFCHSAPWSCHRRTHRAQQRARVCIMLPTSCDTYSNHHVNQHWVGHRCADEPPKAAPSRAHQKLRSMFSAPTITNVLMATTMLPLAVLLVMVLAHSGKPAVHGTVMAPMQDSFEVRHRVLLSC